MTLLDDYKLLRNESEKWTNNGRPFDEDECKEFCRRFVDWLELATAHFEELQDAITWVRTLPLDMPTILKVRDEMKRKGRGRILDDVAVAIQYREGE